MVLSVNQMITDEKTEIDIQKPYKESFVFDTDRKLIIPEYQREIKWKKNRVECLINDILNGEKHLGSILLSTQKECKTFEVIDGQQRLTVLIIIVAYIKEQLNATEPVFCEFENKSFANFLEALKLQFSEEKIKGSSFCKAIIEGDILEQRGLYENIWQIVNNRLNPKTGVNLGALLDNILASTLNVIINYEKNGQISQKRCVDYYLDINNKSEDLDHIDILKAYLFKINFKMMTSEWSAVQRQIKKLSLQNVVYEANSLYYHYFVCTANEKVLNDTLKSLSSKLTTSSKVLSGRTKIPHSSGKHITEVIPETNYYSSMMCELKQFAEFCYYVVTDSFPPGIFETMCVIGGKVKEPNLHNFHVCNIKTILKAILTHDDVAPKMLVMKYYYEVLANKEASKEDYLLIYDIYVCAILFSVACKRKKAEEFTRSIIKSTWKKDIREKSTNSFLTYYENILWEKSVCRKGYNVETGGQEMAKHVLAVRQFLGATDSGVYVYNVGSLRSYFQDVNMSMEHFFVNKSKTFVICNDAGNEVCINCPKELSSLISSPINYLVLNRDKNKKMGNATIWEKLVFLDKLDRQYFGSEMSYQCFLLAKEVFLVEGDYPTVSGLSDEEIKVAVKDYYNEKFFTKLQVYKEKVSKLRLCYKKKTESWEISKNDV